MTTEMILTILIQSVAFIGAFAKMFTDMKIKLKELEIRVIQVEKKDDEIANKCSPLLDRC